MAVGLARRIRLTILLTIFTGLAASPVSAGVIGYEFSINDPIFSTQNGANNVPDFQIENTSQAPGVLISQLSLTIGDTAYNFDFNRRESAFVDAGGDLGFALTSPMFGNNDGRVSDELTYSFTGFDPGDAFRFESDIDHDDGTMVQDFRRILFPGSVLSVGFSDGTMLSQLLNPDDTTLSGYRFAQSTSVSEPATIALFGVFSLISAALYRRRRRQHKDQHTHL